MRNTGFWNLPNSLTVARIVAVPFMVFLLWDMPTASECWLAFLVLFEQVLYAVAQQVDCFGEQQEGEPEWQVDGAADCDQQEKYEG